jgi:CRISPR-associated protein Cmr3
MTRILIEPTDVLIFRTGLPFDAGANSYATGIFPPSPEPLQGALREYLARSLAPGRVLQQVFEEHEQLLGNREHPGQFRMRGPFLARRSPQDSDVIERLYPPPADLEITQGSVPALLQPMDPASDPLVTEWPDDRPLWRLRGSERAQSFGNWLTDDELASWQSGDSQRIAGICGIRPDALWQPEPRFGIMHQRASKVVEEGFLYQLEFVRLRPGVGLDVDIWLDGLTPDDHNLDELLQRGWGRLGGEGRTARYTVVPAATAHAPPQHQRTRLYLATPTLLSDGWRPAGGWTLCGIGAQFITAAVPHYAVIGGWSMRLGDQGGDHKPLARYVPAGSVYYFGELIAWTEADRLIVDPDKRKLGYGVCYAGAW